MKKYLSWITLLLCSFLMVFGFSACSSKDMETNNYEIKDIFINISIDVDTNDIYFFHTGNPDDEIWVSFY